MKTEIKENMTAYTAGGVWLGEVVDGVWVDAEDCPSQKGRYAFLADAPREVDYPDGIEQPVVYFC